MAAEQLFARIGDISCPVKRPADKKEDRAFRKMIHAAQANGDVIINLGEGYFRIDKNNSEQVTLARNYLSKRKSHIKNDAACIRAMETTLGNVDQMSIEDVI